MLKDLLGIEKELIKKEFSGLWLEEDILQATKKDDFEKFAVVIQSRGAKYFGDARDCKKLTVTFHTHANHLLIGVARKRK